MRLPRAEPCPSHRTDGLEARWGRSRAGWRARELGPCRPPLRFFVQSPRPRFEYQMKSRPHFSIIKMVTSGVAAARLRGPGFAKPGRGTECDSSCSPHGRGTLHIEGSPNEVAAPSAAGAAVDDLWFSAGSAEVSRRLAGLVGSRLAQRSAASIEPDRREVLGRSPEGEPLGPGRVPPATAHQPGSRQRIRRPRAGASERSRNDGDRDSGRHRGNHRQGADHSALEVTIGKRCGSGGSCISPSDPKEDSGRHNFGPERSRA